jgi:hypothetical protein
MVKSPHSLASVAGVDFLRSGASATGAVIAASKVLAIIYSHMAGIDNGKPQGTPSLHTKSLAKSKRRVNIGCR